MPRLLVALIVAVAVTFGGAAQARSLPVTTIIIDSARGPRVFHVQVAADSMSQERGLMFRRHLAADAGMLFDFQYPQVVSFWMKNTYLPLDMIFIRADGTISSIARETTPLSEKLIPSDGPVRAVVEINGGRAAALGIEPGDRVRNAIFHDAGR